MIASSYDARVHGGAEVTTLDRQTHGLGQTATALDTSQ
jgi:hypothetical protein